jgi:hypothetical protein
MANMNQLHGAPVSASGAHERAAPTIFAMSTLVIAPPAPPAKNVKHPTPR